MAIQSLLNFSPGAAAPNTYLARNQAPGLGNFSAPNWATSTASPPLGSGYGNVAYPTGPTAQARATAQGKAGFYTIPYSGSTYVPSSLSSPVKSTGTLPGLTRQMTPAESAAWMQNQERSDLGYIANTNAIRGQLAQGWQGGVLTPFSQAYEALGVGQGADASTILNQLKGINAPTWEDPAHAWAQTALGGSLASALSPDVIAAAQSNPYSTMNQIGKALWQANNASDAGLAGAGAYGSSAAAGVGNQNAYSAGLSRYNAVNSFLQNINQNYQNFLGQVGSATTAQGTAAQTAANNLIAQMQAGLISIPTVQNYQAPSGTVTRRNAPGGYYISGKGTYGAKPLY